MKKIVLLSMFLLVMGMSATALAWTPAVQGQPDELHSGHRIGYFVWHDREGMHVWATTRGANHVFTGVIRTDGRFTDVSGERLEAQDYYKKFWGGDTLTFKFDTAGGVDGINFKVKGGDHLDFDLFMDGHRIDRKEIYIGQEGWHPRKGIFQLKR